MKLPSFVLLLFSCNSMSIALRAECNPETTELALDTEVEKFAVNDYYVDGIHRFTSATPVS